MEAFFRQGAPGQSVIQETVSLSVQPGEETARPGNGPEITSDIIMKLNTTQVNEYQAILPSLLEYFKGRTKTFIAGSLAAYFHLWQDLTSDPEILETVTGQKIEFDTWPMQLKPLIQTKLSDTQTESVDLGIVQLLQKKELFKLVHMRWGNLSPQYLLDPRKMAPIA